MLKSALKNRVFFIFIAIICIAGQPAFPQAKEFIRLRSTSYGTIPTNTSSMGEAVAEYYIAAGDLLEIYVWQNTDLTRDVLVRPDGKLSYPLVGTIKAAGMTIDQLQQMITEKLSEYVRLPQVTVSVKESVGNKILVLGQVSYPGIYTFKGTINLLEAVAMAGDFTPDGRRESIMVISDNLTEHPKVRRVDMLTAIRKGTSSSDIILKPNDVVYVPRSTIADFNKFLNEIQPVLNTATTIFTAGTNFSSVAKEARAWFIHRPVKDVPSN